MKNFSRLFSAATMRDPCLTCGNNTRRSKGRIADPKTRHDAIKAPSRH
jgi:hypothetical protein